MTSAQTVPPEYVTALRAFLTGDPAYDMLSQHLAERDGDAGGSIYALLLGMTFTAAARRRFPSHTPADIVRFVGHARAADAARGAVIDPGLPRPYSAQHSVSPVQPRVSTATPKRSPSR